MKKKFSWHLSLRTVLVLFVFGIMLASILVIGALGFLLMRLGVFAPGTRGAPFLPFAILLLISIILGTLLAAVVSNRTLKPLRKIIDATREVAAGDFSVRIEPSNVPEIEDLTTSFNTMVRELESIETLRSDFTSNFSHEFKTPIVSIRGFAKLLRNKNLPEEDRMEYVDIIIQESERLAALSNNVLNLTKLENTGIVTDKSVFFLDEQIRRTAALMEPRWKKKNIRLDLQMERVSIHAGMDLLSQVWVNLLDNAIKFTGEGGHIQIKLLWQPGTAVFSITDDGCGMDEQTLAHVFDKFYQGDRSHTGSGNGLGLALAKQIVTLCEGNIDAQSTLGQGSCFTVTLPLGIDAN